MSAVPPPPPGTLAPAPPGQLKEFDKTMSGFSKPELVKLAISLGILPDENAGNALTKKPLFDLIQSYWKTDEGKAKAQMPQYQRIHTYKKSGGRAAAPAKSSIEKDEADIDAEQMQQGLPPTGANKVLHQQGLSTDPKPQFVKLQTVKGVANAIGLPGNAVDADLTSESSGVASVPEELEKEDSVKAPREEIKTSATPAATAGANAGIANGRGIGPALVLVTLKDYASAMTAGPDAAAVVREVPLVDVCGIIAMNNGKYAIERKVLLPKLTTVDSPVKGVRGRIYLPGAFGSKALISAGDAADIAKGVLRDYFQSEHLMYQILGPAEPGLESAFKTDVFLELIKQGSISGSTQWGADDEAKLEEAEKWFKKQPKRSAQAKDAPYSPPVTEAFRQWLRMNLDTYKEHREELGLNGKKAVNILIRHERYLDVVAEVNRRFKESGRGTGYVIKPTESDQYANQRFALADVQSAIGMNSTMASDDGKFLAAVKSDRGTQWKDTLGEEYEELNNLTQAAFRKADAEYYEVEQKETRRRKKQEEEKRLEEALRKGKAKLAKKEGQSTKRRSSKASLDGSDGDHGRYRSRSKKSGSGDSDHMDDESDGA